MARGTNEQTLAVKYRERTLPTLLGLSVEQALDFFATVRSVSPALTLLNDLGLG